MHYQKELLAQEELWKEKFGKLKLYNSDNEGGYDAKPYLTDYLLQRDTALLEAMKKDLGEMIKKIDIQVIDYPIIKPEVVEFYENAINETKKVAISLLKDYNPNK